MIRWLWSVMLFLLILTPLAAQDSRIGWEEEGLQGKVKQRTRVLYALEGNSRTPVNTTITQYDNLGRAKAQDLLEKDGTPMLRWVFNRDSKGKLTSIQVLDSLNRIQSSAVFTYSPQGKITAEVLRDAGGFSRGQYKFTYDPQNKLTEIQKFMSNGTPYLKTSLDFDTAGLHTATRVTSPLTGVTSKEEHSLNDRGQRTQTLSWASGKLQQKRTYTYDPQGNLKEERFFAAGPGESWTPVYLAVMEYVYWE